MAKVKDAREDESEDHRQAPSGLRERNTDRGREGEIRKAKP